jgi:hypothetical protein
MESTICYGLFSTLPPVQTSAYSGQSNETKMGLFTQDTHKQALRSLTAQTSRRSTGI